MLMIYEFWGSVYHEPAKVSHEPSLSSVLPWRAPLPKCSRPPVALISMDRNEEFYVHSYVEIMFNLSNERADCKILCRPWCGVRTYLCTIFESPELLYNSPSAWVADTLHRWHLLTKHPGSNSWMHSWYFLHQWFADNKNKRYCQIRH